MAHSLLKVLFVFALFALQISWGSCGGSSAPPVSIPAPVTGRITVSTPDDEGLSLVVGDDEAVSADAIVLVINEDKANVAWKLLDLIIPNLLAQSFPARCSLVGRACAQADSNGAFSVEIEAEGEDEITIRVIDTAGNESPQIRKTPPPRGFIHFAVAPLDVAALPSQHFVYALFPGDDTSGQNGGVIRFDINNRQRQPFGFDGTGPTRILTDPTETRLLILDEDGPFAAVVDPDQNNFDSPIKINLPDPGMDVVFEADGETAWITLNGTDNAIAIVDVVGGNILQQISLNDIGDFTHIRSVDIDYARTSSGDEFVALISIYQNPASGALLNIITEINVATRAPIRGPRALPTGVFIRDLAFMEDGAEFLIADPLRDVIQNVIVPADDSDPLDVTPVTASNADAITNPRYIAISADENLAFVTAKNGTINLPDTVLTVDLDTFEVIDITPVGLNPQRLVWDETNNELFVVSTISRSLTLLPLSVLTPGNPDLF